jgi:hypothetical protein
MSRLLAQQIYHADIRTDTVSMLTRGCKKLRSLTLGRCSPVTVLSSHLVPFTVD